MKSFSAILTLSSIFLHNATSEEINNRGNRFFIKNRQKLIHSSLLPEDVGLIHTHVIHNLQHKFEEKLPQSSTEYLYAVSLEMRNAACDFDDPICNSRIVRKTIDIEQSPEEEIDSLEYVQSITPNNFDPEVMNYIEDLYSSTNRLNIENPNHALTRMRTKMEELTSSEQITNEKDRDIGIMAYSVGIESAKQWAEVLTNPTDPFHLLIQHEAEEHNDRKLQSEDGDSRDSFLPFVNVNLPRPNIPRPKDARKFIQVVNSDITGAIRGALKIDVDGENTFIGHAVEEATLASLKSFMLQFIDPSNFVNLLKGECFFPGAFWCDMLNLPDLILNVIAENPCAVFPSTEMCDLFMMNGFSNLDPCMIPNNPFCDKNNVTVSEFLSNITDTLSNINFTALDLSNITDTLSNINFTALDLSNITDTLSNINFTELDPCLLYPELPICTGNGTAFEPCEAYPNLPICSGNNTYVDPCEIYPDLLPFCGGNATNITNLDPCQMYPTLPFCTGNATNITNIDPCLLYPGLSLCTENSTALKPCVANPSLPFCAANATNACLVNPSLTFCSGNITDLNPCIVNPNLPICSGNGTFIDPCTLYQYLPTCTGNFTDCDTYPESPLCSGGVTNVNPCTVYPNIPICNGFGGGTGGGGLGGAGANFDVTGNQNVQDQVTNIISSTCLLFPNSPRCTNNNPIESETRGTKDEKGKDKKDKENDKNNKKKKDEGKNKDQPKKKNPSKKDTDKKKAKKHGSSDFF